MRKVFILLLVVGLLVGILAVAEEISQEFSTEEHVESSDKNIPDGDVYGDPTPCGGGSGGDGGIPG